MTSIRTIILAGGRGTRLHPYTVHLPKPLLPVGDRPILEIVLERLRAAGIDRATLAVNHMADMLISHFGDGSRLGIAVDFSREATPLGTIGPLRLIPDLPDDFLVMNGDILTDLDYRRFWEEHRAAGALATVAVVRRPVIVDFGVLEVSPSGDMLSFREKPRLDQHVSMGVYVFRREILDYVPRGVPFGFDDLMSRLLAEGIRVHCYLHDGEWLDVGRPDDYLRAQR